MKITNKTLTYLLIATNSNINKVSKPHTTYSTNISVTKMYGPIAKVVLYLKSKLNYKYLRPFDKTVER